MIVTAHDEKPNINDVLASSANKSLKMNANKNGVSAISDFVYGTPTFLLHCEHVAGKPGPKKHLRMAEMPG